MALVLLMEVKLTTAVFEKQKLANCSKKRKHYFLGLRNGIDELDTFNNRFLMVFLIAFFKLWVCVGDYSS